MAGLGGLPYFIQYQGELQNQALQRQQAQQQLMQFQQAQQDRQQRQAALAAAGNALPQLVAPPPQVQQPAPQPPAPGQPSQPAPQQAGGGVPLPPGAPPGVRPPLPPGGVQGTLPPAGLPPFRPMPTTPPASAAPQGAIPAPPMPAAAPAQQPQGGPLTMQSAIKVLQDQGLSGADLMAGLQQLTPLLDAQSRQQAAQAQQQFQHELQIAQLQERYDAMHQASQDRQASLAERTQAHQDSLAVREQIVGMQAQSLKLRLQQGDDSKLTPDEASVLGEQLAKGDTSVLSNLGRGTQGAANVVAVRKAAIQYAKDNGLSAGDLAANIAQFGGEKAAARTTAVASGKQSQAADEASQLADQALDVSGKIQRTNFPTMNAAINAARKAGGDPSISEFAVANNGFKNTYSRAISPTGTPTVHDKQHADELFSLDQSPAQYAASVAQAKKEMAAAINAPKDVQRAQRARIAGNAPASNTPAVGTVDSGYRFKGGDPASPSSWERVQ